MRITSIEQQLREQPRTWLVTGAAGFVGSHLVERLLKLGQQVRGLDNFSTGKRENLPLLEQAVGSEAWSRFEMIEGGICDEATCLRACADVRHVLHQAALGSVPRSIKYPKTTLQTNVHGFAQMLEASREAGCKTFVYASSSSVYGDSPILPKQENETGKPRSPYAASKCANESFAAAWSESYKMHIVGLRYFNVVGSRQDPNGQYAAVIPRWIDAFLQNQSPIVYGDGHSSRDFCPVENITQANLLATAVRTQDTIFNVALGGQTTLLELFTQIRDLLVGLGSDVGEMKAQYEDFRIGDILHSLASIERAKRQLGYLPECSFEEGLKQTVQWFAKDIQPSQKPSTVDH